MRMRKTFVSTLCIAIIAFSLSMMTNALGGNSIDSNVHKQIDHAVREELSKANIPNAAISIVQGGDVEYLSYPSTDNRTVPDMNALFQIGSLSKAFTGFAVLLLEDEGLLSLDDPVSKHLPWFTVCYEGSTVPSESFTVADLLYQTSGFTNSEANYPGASAGMSIEESVRQISGSELAFYPSQQFAYANTNYRILGLIIETVSGQSYDVFMTEHILLPLGLNNTYTDPLKAQDMGEVVSGSRLSFFKTWSYDIPVAAGNVPAGYIYSCAKDMSRWLQIHMGAIEVTEQFQRIAEKSHRPNPDSVVNDNTNYSAGWYVNSQTGEVYHSGGTPNYSANVAIRPQSNIAVCVLTNINTSQNTNSIAASILNILEGTSVSAYQADIWTVFDLIFSCITIAGIVGSALLIFVVSRLARQLGNGRRQKVKLTRKRLLYFIPALFLILLTVLVIVLLPTIFSSPWVDIVVWAPLSVPSGIVALIVVSICAFGVSFAVATFKKSGNEASSE